MDRGRHVSKLYVTDLASRLHALHDLTRTNIHDIPVFLYVVSHFDFSSTVSSTFPALAAAGKKNLAAFKWFTFKSQGKNEPNSRLAQPYRLVAPFDASSVGPSLVVSDQDHPTVLRFFLLLLHNTSIMTRTALHMLVEETNRYAEQRIAAKNAERAAAAPLPVPATTPTTNVPSPDDQGEKFHPVTLREMCQWLGLTVLMGIV